MGGTAPLPWPTPITGALKSSFTPYLASESPYAALAIWVACWIAENLDIAGCNRKPPLCIAIEAGVCDILSSHDLRSQLATAKLDFWYLVKSKRSLLFRAWKMDYFQGTLYCSLKRSPLGTECAIIALPKKLLLCLKSASYRTTVLSFLTSNNPDFLMSLCLWPASIVQECSLCKNERFKFA